MTPRSILERRSWGRTLIALLSMTFANSVAAQEAGLNAPSTAVPTANQFRGVDRCRDCHRVATPERIKVGVTDFVSLNESEVWVADIHSRAFELIDPTKSNLGKQMCDKLGIENIHESRACLSCHSDWRPGLERPPTYERGVACESCHGPSRKWDADHSESVWRAKPVADKEALGMIDVRHPIERAEQCFGCHIGNVAEGKVITHAMYAAGHPPLPSIEIESFAAQMPRHWRYLDEKIADAKRTPAGSDPDSKPFKNYAAFLRENHRYLKSSGEQVSIEVILGHKHRPAAVVLGGAIALREYIELIRDLASTEEPVEYAWPELATLDCRACHHELEVPSRRQEQRLGSIPGRPTIPRWPSVLVPLAIRHAYPPARDDEKSSHANAESMLIAFQRKLDAVEAELARTPFGSPLPLQNACSELLTWLDDALITKALERPFDGRAASDSFRLLADIAKAETYDFDSARQIAWAIRILSCGIANDALREAIQASLATPAVELRLDLPNGPAEQCAPVLTIDESRPPAQLATQLADSLAAPIQYDPGRFQTQMQKLRELLPGATKPTE